MKSFLIGVLIIGGLAVSLLAGLYIWLEKSIIPKKSTLAFWKLGRMTLRKRLEGYLYASRPDIYLKPATWNWFFEHFNMNENCDTYHGKVITQGDASVIVSMKQPLEIVDLERIVPYSDARSLILEHPMPSIAVIDCPCRDLSPNGCQPRDVCMIVGEPFVSFVLEHRPKKSRRVNTEEALKILEEEEKRGHIHSAWFKDVLGGRFYAICNCCTCCCLALASYSRGANRIAHSGYAPVVDVAACLQCGICTDICPFRAVEHGVEAAVVNLDKCMGCGVCVSHCPTDSLALRLAPEKGIPLKVNAFITN